MPTSPETRQSEIEHYAGLIDAAYPAGPSDCKSVNGKLVCTGPVVDLGQDYVKYMADHPSLNPALVYEAVMARLTLLQSVPAGIGKAVGAATGTVAKTATDLGGDTSSLYPTWLQGFLSGNGILRVAEGILGVVIIAVSLDKLMNGNAGPATTIARVFK